MLATPGVKEKAELRKVPILDHVIGDGEYASFKELGLM